MPQRVEERVRPITPQLAWRVAVLGGIAFVLFGIVFFRLWYLQVLTGQEAVAQRQRQPRAQGAHRGAARRHRRPQQRHARADQARRGRADGPEPAARERARGRRRPTARTSPRPRTSACRPQDSYDAFRRQLRDDGRKNTKAEKRERARAQEGRPRRRAPVAVPTVRPQTRPTLIALYKRMGHVLQISPKTIHKRVIRGIADAPYSNVTIRTDVAARAVQLHARVRRRTSRASSSSERYLRQLPAQAARRAAVRARVRDRPGAAQGRRSTRASPRARGSARAGSRSSYDKYLRGTDGYQTRRRRRASAAATTSASASVREPKQGQRLKLTLDYNLQQAGDEALAKAIAASQYGARAGAYVAMDPRDGAILAMGSQPGFDANVFARPFSQKIWKTPDLAGDRRAAAQPRDRLGLSDRLDVQADHGAGGARVGPDQGQRQDHRRPATTSSARRSTRTPRARASARSTCPTP